MLVDITARQIFKEDIEPEEAFRILCKTLSMDFILNDDPDYFVAKDASGQNIVCKGTNGKVKIVDDRGDLFIALCNVAVNMFPNLDFRSANYIYGNQ